MSHTKLKLCISRNVKILGGGDFPITLKDFTARDSKFYEHANSFMLATLH